MTNQKEACELCEPNMVLLENEHAYVRHDNNSLSPGHMLAIPRRHLACFFDMTWDEKTAVLRLPTIYRHITCFKSHSRLLHIDNVESQGYRRLIKGFPVRRRWTSRLYH